MKSHSVQFIIFLLLVGVSSCKPDYNPNKLFSREQQTKIIQQSVRYSTKLPPGATYETRFNPEFYPYYDLATAEYDIRASAVDKDGYFFLMTRKARSIWPAR